MWWATLISTVGSLAFNLFGGQQPITNNSADEHAAQQQQIKSYETKIYIALFIVIALTILFFIRKK